MTLVTMTCQTTERMLAELGFDLTTPGLTAASLSIELPGLDYLFTPELNPFPHKDVSAADGVLKTWRQEEKLLKTTNYSFCHHVFNSIQSLYFHLKGVSNCLRVCFQSLLL